jgi:hypothetical protein
MQSPWASAGPPLPPLSLPLASWCGTMRSGLPQSLLACTWSTGAFCESSESAFWQPSPGPVGANPSGPISLFSPVRISHLGPSRCLQPSPTGLLREPAPRATLACAGLAPLSSANSSAISSAMRMWSSVHSKLFACTVGWVSSKSMIADFPEALRQHTRPTQPKQELPGTATLALSPI